MTEQVGTVPSAETPKGIGLGYIMYQQVAGVLGAFALIAFISHFFAIGWRGALADLIGMWDAYVRPAMKVLFDVSLIAFLKWVFGWTIQVPLFVRDYLAVGIVVLFSYLRIELFYWRNHLGLFLYRNRLVSKFVACLFLWPVLFLMLFVFTAKAIRMVMSGEGHVQTYPSLFNTGDIWVGLMNKKKGPLLFFSPFLYLALLLAANFLILKPGS